MKHRSEFEFRLVPGHVRDTDRYVRKALMGSVPSGGFCHNLAIPPVLTFYGAA